jgi:CHAT domain-containing protein
MRKCFLRTAIVVAALCAATQAGSQVDHAAASRKMNQFSTFLTQGRLDEAEVLARELDASHGGGKRPWTDAVAMARKAAAVEPESTAPPALFTELGDTFDVAAMQVPPPSDTPQGLNQRGVALHKAGDLHAAIQAYDAAEAALRQAAQAGGYAAGASARYSLHIPIANRAMAYWQLGELDKAWRDVRSALDERAPFEHGLMNAYKGERDMLLQARSKAQELHAILSLEHALGAPRSSIGLQALLERKGAVLEKQAAALAALRRNAQSQSAGGVGILSLLRGSVHADMERDNDRQRVERLQALTRERSQLATLPPGTPAEQAERSQRMAELDRLIQGVQRDMQVQSEVRAEAPGFFSLLRQTITRDTDGELKRREEERTRSLQSARSALVQQVRDAIPADAVLLEMVRYRSFDPRRRGEASWGAERYGTYVLSRHAEPVYVDLGEAQALERLVRDFRRALAQDPQDARRLRDLARRLDEAVMRPVRAASGAARTLYVAPEGALNLVPLAALVDEEGRFLVERYTVNYLASGRDLLLPGRDAPRGPATVIANPAFNLAGAAGAAAGGSRSVDFTRVQFTPLPGTDAEAKALAQLLPDAVTITGEQATETTAKRLAGPRILHIATHGFFLEEKRAATAREPEDPMLRSGLVFAGVNRLRSGEDDGVLTALEAATLDLRGTQLVVLSACETGVGEVRNGEGVFGLRRAFAVAGAETLVMSLWQVADDATMELMAGFYARLAEGMPRAEALRQSQLALLRKPDTAAPFFWAAFISSGQAGPLQ